MREIVEEGSFVQARDAINPDVRRMDEIMLNVMDRLARRPEGGQETHGPGIWAVPTRPWPEAPELVVYYRFDDRKVYLMDVEQTVAEE